MESEGSDSSNNKIEGKYSTKMMKKAVNTAIEKFGKGLGRWETVDDVTNLEPIASSTPRERDYNEERILPGPSDAQLKRIHERIGYTQGETSNDSFESSSEDFHRNRNRIDDFDDIDNRKKIDLTLIMEIILDGTIQIEDMKKTAIDHNSGIILIDCKQAHQMV